MSWFRRCTAATSAKDCLELTLHAQQAGADIVYIQTPMMEAHAGEGVLRFFRYIADRTRHRPGDVQLTVLGVRADTRRKRPDRRGRSRPCAPPRRARSGRRRAVDCMSWRRTWRSGNATPRCTGPAGSGTGIVCPAQLGTAGYLYETPQRRIFTEYWDLVYADRLIEAMDFGRESGLDQFSLDIGSVVHLLPGPGRLFHPLGRRLQARGLRAGPAHRRLPALPSTPGRNAPGCCEDPDRDRLSESSV